MGPPLNTVLAKTTIASVGYDFDDNKIHDNNIMFQNKKFEC